MTVVNEKMVYVQIAVTSRIVHSIWNKNNKFSTKNRDLSSEMCMDV